MANKKDVKLVISAEDNASKALADIVKSLHNFIDAQDDVSSGATKVGNMFGKLGAEAANLGRDLQALAELKRATTELDSLRNSVTRLGDSVQRQKGTTAQLISDYGKAADAARKQKDAADRASEAVKRQTENIKETSAALDSLKGRQTGAAASFKIFEEAELRSQREELKRLRNEQKATTQEAKLSKAQADSLQRSAVQYTTSLREQRTRLGESTREMTALSNAVDRTRSKLGLAALDQANLGSAAEKAAADLAKVNAALRLQGSAPQAQKTRQESLGLQNSQLLNQINATRTARSEWERAREEATRLGATLAQTATPTREMQRAFAVAQASSRLAREEYQKQAQSLNTLRGVTQGTFAQFQQRIRSAMDPAPVRATGAAFDALAPQVKKGTSAFNELYGASRKSMSLFQRLRGEILSLTASVVGLYAAFRQIDETIKAYQTLEAVQNRLGAVFQQNTTAVAREVRFLREEAIRLGTSFQVLGDEYSKLAVATSAAGFAQESTRKLFLAVAEAGRVNKLSMDNMSGIFLALQQMVSKGKVNAEELQRQLGDRLPGAVNIMANAMGITVAEMVKMMQVGQLLANEDNMMKFADELNKRFGKQLPEALKSMTTQMQRFQAIIFERRMQVGEGGFAASLQKAFAELNEVLQGEGGDKLVTAMTNSMAGLVNAGRLVLENFSAIVTLLKGLIALKMAQFFVALAGNIRTAAMAQAQLAVASSAAATGLTQFVSRSLLTSMGNLAVSTRALQLAVTQLGAGFTAARAGAVIFSGTAVAVRGVVTALTAAFRALWVAVGGFVGLALVAVTFLATELLGKWVTGVDAATEALQRHQDRLGKIQSAYEKVKAGASDWATELQEISAIELKADISKFEKEFKKASDGLARALEARGRQAGPRYQKAIEPFRGTIEAFQRGEISAYDLSKAIDEIVAKGEGIDRKVAANLDKLARSAYASSKALKESAAALDLKKNASVATAEATLGLSNSLEDANAALAYSKTIDQFRNSIEDLTKAIPELATEMDRLKKIKDLRGDLEPLAKSLFDPAFAAEASQLMRLQARREFLVNVDSFAGGKATPELQAAAALLQRLEGFQPTGKWDTNAYRAGYGSDTVTLADGSIDKIAKGTAVSQEDALRDLVRRISGEFMPRARDMVGAEIFDRLSADQKAVLTSLAYNSANVLRPVAEALKSGAGTEQVAEAIRKAGSNLPSFDVLRGRRAQEAEIFAGRTAGNASSETQRLQAQREFLENIEKQNEQRKFEIELARQTNREQEISKAIREAQLEAQKKGVQFDKAAEESIRRSVGEKFDELNRQKEMEEAIALATEKRALLLEQIAYQQAEGNTGAVATLKEELEKVNEQLRTAIANAIAMWREIGGPEAERQIIKLQSQSLQVAKANQRAVDYSTQLNSTIANGGASAMDRFAKSIAEGENALSSLRDTFLQFASDVLREMAKIIAQRAIMNMLGASDGGGGVGGILGGFINSIFGAGVMHTGGIVGNAPATRLASPAWFANATRYHGGGIAGLKPNEVPTILERGEEVLTAADPRHRANGGAGANVKIVNTFDPASYLSEALNTKAGEQIFLNFVRANPGAFKQALGT